MKKWITFEVLTIVFALSAISLESCAQNAKEAQPEKTNIEKKISPKPKKNLAANFKKYWYSGNAEITSYTLNQARYGEMRKGDAVLIYVTEPFLADKQVKADADHLDNIPILKLNTTKNYITGIYPYAIMTSSFHPVHDDSHAVKVSFSSQEWCGNVYAQLNNREKFDVVSHSYFENEADQSFSLEKTHLENEIWNKIRIDPKHLPIGSFDIIPSLEYIRLTHKPFKEYKANGTITAKNDTIQTYTITYTELERTLKIDFTKAFPHTIEGWSETYLSGFGGNAKLLTTSALKNKLIITPYWQQNKNSDLFLRDSLGL